MGSATTQALAATASALDAAKGVTVEVAGELFAVARAIDGSIQLSGALADPSVPAEVRADAAAKVFGSASAPTVEIVRSAVSQRWSRSADLVAGLEDLGIRAASIGAGKADVAGELFEVSGVIAGSPELELALGSRLGDSEAKSALVQRILGSEISEATSLIVSSLVRNPRGRRVRQLLTHASDVVSAQRGQLVATVHSAAPITATRQKRLRTALSERYGTDVTLHIVIDPAVLGGLRVQVGDDVIDGSISARLAELRTKLAA